MSNVLLLAIQVEGSNHRGKNDGDGNNGCLIHPASDVCMIFHLSKWPFLLDLCLIFFNWLIIIKWVIYWKKCTLVNGCTNSRITDFQPENFSCFASSSVSFLRYFSFFSPDYLLFPRLLNILLQ